MAQAISSGRKLAVLLLTGAVVAAPAAAQRRAGDDDRISPLSTDVARGPGVAGTGGFADGLASGLAGAAGGLVRGFRIEASLGTLFDGNIRRIGEGVESDIERADFRITPAVAASTVLPLGRQQLYLEADYGRDFYVRNDGLDRDRYGFGGGVNLRAGNFCSGNIAAAYKRRQSLLSEASILGDNTITSRNYSAAFNCQRQVGLGFGGSVSRDERDNAGVARDVFDSRSTVFSGNVSYTLASFGTVSAGGSFNRVDYPSRTVLVNLNSTGGSEDDAVDIYSGNLNYRRSFGTRIDLNLGASYYLAQPDPRDVILLIPFVTPVGTVVVPIPQSRDKFSGAGYNLRVTYRPSQRLSADAYAVRNISSSSSVGALYSVLDSFGLDIGYKLRPSISTGVGITFDKRRYEDSFPSTEEVQARADDDITRIYGRVTLTARRLFDVDFEVAHQIRKADPSIFDYSSTSAQLILRAQFGRR